MAIQQSINQGITGAMFLLSQSPMMEARRTKKKLEVEEHEELARGQRIVERAKKARDAGLAAADETVEEAKKEDKDESSARYIEKSNLAEGQRLVSLEDYADAVRGAYGQEEEYAKAKQAALSKRGNMQGDYIAGMQGALQKKMEEETRARINTKGVLEALREKERRSYNG